MAAAIDTMSRMNRLHMDRMADEDEDPNLREGIKYPGKHDVMLGRGGESTYHCGNIAFRQLVEDHKTKYYTCPRAHKSRVVAEVVKKWRQLSPPGRFLTRTNPGAGDKSPWHDVGDSRALKKASHSLRDAVRCFSVEKKQRAAQAEREREEAGGGRLMTEEAEITVVSDQSDSRKRSRGGPGADFFLSSSRVGSNKLSAEMDARNNHVSKPKLGGSAFFLANSRVGSGKLSQELELVAARKPLNKIIVAPAFEERPAKRARVVCDEREEAQEDCRREGSDGDEDSLVRACNEQRDCGGGRDACDFRDSIPSTISWERPQAPPAETFSFEPSLFRNSSNQRQQKQKRPSFTFDASFFNPSKRREQVVPPAPRLPSPCGSADWFTPATEDLPVQASSFALPTADVLVQEVAVVVSDSGRDGQRAPAATSDDEYSLGWFSHDGEQDMASFSSAPPLFNVDLLHKPVAVASGTNRVSSGRE